MDLKDAEALGLLLDVHNMCEKIIAVLCICPS